MPTPIEYACSRFEMYAKAIIAPAIVKATAPLNVGVWQCADPVPFGVAAAAAYKPVAPGFEWGPAWTTAWFKATGRVPAELSGGPVWLRFSSDTEALAWVGGVPRQGFDVNRDAMRLLDSAKPGEPVEVFVEAACNHPFGAAGLQWDTPEVHRRWAGPTPGRLLLCELAVIDETVWRLYWSHTFATQLVRQLPETSPRAGTLVAALTRATNMLRDDRIGGMAAGALAVIEAELARPAGGSATLCHAVGHAHIDTAWLWPLRETRRKCLRTFSNVLRLMEQDEGFVFLCSQAQQYAYVEEDAPALFEQISKRVKEGRWEPGGGMWIESDVNAVSLESLARQVLHGTRWWRSRFGTRGNQRFLYLPDTFGFSAALPQVMALSGLDTFITNKIAWNDTNVPPNTTFWWRGLDGTRVLAHFTPGHDYNATNTPKELLRGQHQHKAKHLVCRAPSAGEDPFATGTGARWLQPFGYGDGGGGPTDWMLLNTRLSADADGLPRTRFSRTDDFCEALHRDVHALEAAGLEVPAWEGELYLELHRGTLTTHARLKQANIAAEQGLRLAEMLIAGAPASPAGPQPSAVPPPDNAMTAAWRTTLLNQFHDILPGSSIPQVYQDAAKDHALVQAVVEPRVEGGLSRWAEALGGVARNASARTESGGTPANGAMVFNPASRPTRGVVEFNGRTVWCPDVPAVGARTLTPAELSAVCPVAEAVSIAADERTRTAELFGGGVRVRVDALGRVVGLRVGDGPELCAQNTPMNELVLSEDRPRMWDAWDVDREHLASQVVQASAATRWRVVESAPHFVGVEVTRPIGERSTIVQTIGLSAGSKAVLVRTRVDWRERHRLLRALFPATVERARWLTSTHGGHLERPTHTNTTWEHAAFEVPCQRWTALTGATSAVGVINDSRFGCGLARGDVQSLSLLRSPTYPDPEADQGEHTFTYGLVPAFAPGGFVPGEPVATIDAAAERLNRPLRAVALAVGQEGRAWAPIDLAGSPGWVVDALKPAEDGGAVVLRLHDSLGLGGTLKVRWTLPVSSVQPVNLLEEPMALGGFGHDETSRTTTLSTHPFQVVTLRATLG